MIKDKRLEDEQLDGYIVDDFTPLSTYLKQQKEEKSKDSNAAKDDA